MLLTIEKLIYGGEGLARLPADASGRGKAVFVPFVLTGEKIEGSLTEQKPGFARARVEQILEPSPHRVQPGCPYFGSCGGCHYQHASYEHQLEIKKEILRETLRRTAKLEGPVEIEVHPSPPWNYRNRSRLQVQTSPSFKTGYFQMGSHELLAIEQCPISSPLINRAIAALRQSGRANKVPEGVHEVEFFANADDSQVMVEVSATQGARRAALREWAEDLRTSLAEIIGIVVFRSSSPSGSGLPEKLLTIGADHLLYQTKNAAYRVSAGSFFQTNRYLIDELVRIVTQGQSGELALDLYAGAGLFSTALGSDMRHIISVESSQTSTNDLSYNQTSNGEVVQATTEQYLARGENKGRVGKGAVLTHTLHKPDLAVVDPPRSGLGERVARGLPTLGAPRVIYVSCDPATLARDLVPLLASGYRIEQVHLVDLFPQTFHLETVVHLAR
ncbi:MAG TPA: 23S rRNA (uracil(1939)-C(5))-methyltransferase RlmD [Candidatus Sulfotelmatobacter sp.]|nr:23S rRNA (uracil(1939)-C(5))-methyltransferase RlmD [Candidatus Sulfotelmatobacter sp.]